MKMVWDPKKAASIPKNHDGVTFEEAQHVLLDPFALTREGSEATIRLISAWKANEQQLRRYESASSDEMYNKYKDFNFSDAKPVAETPHLAHFKRKPSVNLALP
jgi:hypothetical protein